MAAQIIFMSVLNEANDHSFKMRLSLLSPGRVLGPVVLFLLDGSAPLGFFFLFVLDRYQTRKAVTQNLVLGARGVLKKDPKVNRRSNNGNNDSDRYRGQLPESCGLNVVNAQGG